MAKDNSEGAGLNLSDTQVNKRVLNKIEGYRKYFEQEMREISTNLEEFKKTKEEFYRRWSAYADFSKVEELLK